MSNQTSDAELRSTHTPPVLRGTSHALRRPRAARAAYLTTTSIVLMESLAGGILDLTRQAPFYPAMLSLGYPPYFADILGTAKLLAVAALLAPGLPRIKEWAYAGILINMLGAAASHLAMHDGVGNVVPPTAFAVITLVSWELHGSVGPFTAALRHLRRPPAKQ